MTLNLYSGTYIFRWIFRGFVLLQFESGGNHLYDDNYKLSHQPKHHRSLCLSGIDGLLFAARSLRSHRQDQTKPSPFTRFRH